MPMAAINGKSRLPSARFRAGTVVGVELPNKVFTSRMR
jgi:hypothetical protein